MNNKTNPTILEYIIVIILIAIATPIMYVAIKLKLIGQEQIDALLKHDTK